MLSAVCLSLPVSWTTYSGRSQLPGPEAPLVAVWRCPCDKELRLLDSTSWGAFLEVDPPGISKASYDATTGNILTGISQETLSQNTPWIPFWDFQLSEIVEIINVCCFKPLSLGVTCYTVIDIDHSMSIHTQIHNHIESHKCIIIFILENLLFLPTQQWENANHWG